MTMIYRKGHGTAARSDRLSGISDQDARELVKGVRHSQQKTSHGQSPARARKKAGTVEVRVGDRMFDVRTAKLNRLSKAG